MATRLTELRELHTTYPLPPIRPLLARPLRNAASMRGQAGNRASPETHLDQLTALHEDYPEPRIREQLAATLLNTANVYAEVHDAQVVTHCLDRLEDLTSTHDTLGLGTDVDPAALRVSLRSLVAKLLALNDRLTLRALRVGRVCLPQTQWNQLYNDIILPLDQRVADCDPSVETYRDIVDLG